MCNVNFFRQEFGTLFLQSQQSKMRIINKGEDDKSFTSSMLLHGWKSILGSQLCKMPNI